MRAKIANFTLKIARNVNLCVLEKRDRSTAANVHACWKTGGRSLRSNVHLEERVQLTISGLTGSESTNTNVFAILGVDFVIW